MTMTAAAGQPCARLRFPSWRYAIVSSAARYATKLWVMIVLGSIILGGPMRCLAGEPVRLTVPYPPPVWALLERELLRANDAACQAFYTKYFDERGYLLCVERWGGDDGPDDAIENCAEWPLLHALGGADATLKLYRRAWEGHLRQYTEARTRDVPFARDGMYFREFPVMMDWLHHGEGLTAFAHQGLSEPDDPAYQARVRRFAGFYLNDDPLAPNYDPQHKIIRSLLNGSRGPLLRAATAVDWAGDPIEIAGRFQPAHGESSYEEMLAHFQDYRDVVGDHPSNLLATSLAVNAYLLTHEPRYKTWVLEYVDAWRQRMADNQGIIPSNIGLDGTPGGAAHGQWWGGVYGWGFSVKDPATGEMAHRSTFQSGFQGFMNAFLLTGDKAYLLPWRQMLNQVNAQAKRVDGRTMYPSKYGQQGWYAYTATPFAPFANELFYLTQEVEDRQWITTDRWHDFLTGQAPDYPEQRLREDLERIRARLQAMQADPTTPDTRLSDDPMKYAPCSVQSLVELTLGGVDPGHRGAPLFAAVRYFDPEQRRAGLPPQVAALVEKLSPQAIEITLVNLDLVRPHTVILQGGAYAEHQFTTVRLADQTATLDSPHCHVHLQPGCGGKITLSWRRFALPPTLTMPWQLR